MFEDFLDEEPPQQIQAIPAAQVAPAVQVAQAAPQSLMAPIKSEPDSSSDSPSVFGGKRLQDVLSGETASWAVPLAGALLSAMHPVGARAVQGANAGLQVTDRYRKAADQDAKDKALARDILGGLDGAKTVSKKVPMGQMGSAPGSYGSAGEEGPYIPPEVAAANPALNTVQQTTQPIYSDAEKRLIQLYAQYNPKLAAEYAAKLQFDKSKERPLHVTANPELGIYTTDPITGETVQRAQGTPKETTTTNRVDAGTHWLIESVDKRTGRVVDSRKIPKELNEVQRAELGLKAAQEALNRARIGEVGAQINAHGASAAASRATAGLRGAQTEEVKEKTARAKDPENLTEMTVGQLGSALSAARGQATGAESKEDRIAGATAARNITKELAKRTDPNRNSGGTSKSSDPLGIR